MKSAAAFGAILLLPYGQAAHGQLSDSSLIQAVRMIPATSLDPTASRSLPLSLWLAQVGHADLSLVQWELNDCGEGGDGREAPRCVEGSVRMFPDTTIGVDVLVAGSDGRPADRMVVFQLFVKTGSELTFPKSFREIETLVAHAQASVAFPGTDAVADITEISLQRTPCYGVCPVDLLVLHANGSATYTGKQNAPLQGSFSGSFDKAEFGKLAQWLLAERFFEMQGSYGGPNADTPTEVIRATISGKQKAVVNNSIEASELLSRMGKAIEGIRAGIKWREAPVRR